ncbi:putative hydrolase [Dactylonectria macrodidyma]|uniref:Hydrolase n=1 Tax=Dactylonectria macrodidyma TaxID=307937 RepID=A0A9P9EGX3_9HYPO|nr:putative hydrolase [Dactylonectria macrodidyma]
MTVFSVRNVGVFNGETIERPTHLCFQGSPGNILPKDTEARDDIDGTNCTLLPGFIDSKIAGGASSLILSQSAMYGVTTLIDSSSGTAESLAMRTTCSQNVGMPSYLASGSVVGSDDSGSDMLKLFPYRAIRHISTPAEAVSFVEGHSKEPGRLDFVKVIVDIPGLDDDTLSALVEATHQRGMLAVAHASQTDSYRRVLDAGFDIVTPAPINGALGEDVIRGLAARKIAVIPILVFLRHLLRQGSIQEHNFTYALEAVRALHKAGVPICAGTSANNEEGFKVSFGEGLHEELQLLAQAGFSNLEAIQAATSVPSTMFNLSDRGALQLGYRADLVLVQGNPLEDLAASARIIKVWIQGIEVGSGGNG